MDQSLISIRLCFISECRFVCGFNRLVDTKLNRISHNLGLHVPRSQSEKSLKGKGLISSCTFLFLLLILLPASQRGVGMACAREEKLLSSPFSLQILSPLIIDVFFPLAPWLHSSFTSGQVWTRYSS
jgi:hypothetical protein